MKLKAIIHDAEEGGFWAEVPVTPGCVSQGETMDELIINLREAVEVYLAIDIEPPRSADKGRILEIAV
jgi:predicted RNase H-like HicB family nuclease